MRTVKMRDRGEWTGKERGRQGKEGGDIRGRRDGGMQWKEWKGCERGN